MSGSASTDPAAETQRTAGRSPPATGLVRGQLVGRYVVIETSGEGAMGAVYRAYDPDLDRRVAIKVLRSEATPSRSARLMREAQAIARLSHPNIVAVHDVGIVEGRVFVAMEFIEGSDLHRWLHAANRSPKEILAVFSSAGEGLAAAHDAGLVHRDFKPENVMLADDGRPRVVDFGLVRAADVGTDPGGESRGPVSVLTASGTVMGTPAYMAPEQFDRGDVGPAADQFAFSVALYEALYGQRPFDAGSIAELRLAVTRGDTRPTPSRADVPARVARALARGLAAEPEQRYPSMRALLAALAGRPRSRLRSAAGAAAVGLAVAGGVLAFAGYDDEEPCTRGDERIAGVWGATHRERVVGAVTASERTYAQRAADDTAAGLDDYAAQWSAMHRETCEATHVWGTQSSELFDKRMGCLEEARRQLGALAEVLAQGEAGAVDHAVSAVDGLPPVARCEDVAALQELAPLPADPQLRARLDAAREAVAHGRALVLAGSYRDAVSSATDLIPEVDAIGYAPLVARAHSLKAWALNRIGEEEAAEAELDLALVASQRAGQDRQTAIILSQLLWIVGTTPSRGEEADRLFALANATIERFGGDDELSAIVAMHHADSLQTRGRYRDALDAARLGLALSLELGNETRIAEAHIALGSVLRKLGEFDEAVISLQRAHEMLVARKGADHPRTLGAANNLGNAHLERGEGDAALALFESTLAGLERNLGPSHPHVATAAMNVGLALLTTGSPERARAPLAKAVRLYGDDPQGAAALSVLANLETREGRLEEALALATRAHDLALARDGPDHPGLAVFLSERAVVYRKLGRLEEARHEHERAVALAERAFEPRHPAVNAIRMAASETFAAAGRHDEAIAVLERAVADEAARDDAGAPMLTKARSALERLRAGAKAPPR